MLVYPKNKMENLTDPEKNMIKSVLMRSGENWRKTMNEMFDDLMKGFDEIDDDIKSHGEKLKRNNVLYIPVKKYTGKEVKKIRENVGMTQKSFAAYLGVSNKTVEAWEAGINVPAGSSSRILSMMEMDSELPEKYPFVSSGK